MRTIKRYPNRKLYDTKESKYVTLEEIAKLLLEEGNIKVVDSKSGEDLTSIILTQVLLEREKKGRKLIPLDYIRTILQSGHAFFEKIATPVTSFKEEAEKKVSRIQLSAKEDLKTFIDNTQKLYEDVTKIVEDRFQLVTNTISRLSSFMKEFESLKKEVSQLKEKVEEIEKMVKKKPVQKSKKNLD